MKKTLIIIIALFLLVGIIYLFIYSSSTSVPSSIPSIASTIPEASSPAELILTNQISVSYPSPQFTGSFPQSPKSLPILNISLLENQFLLSQANKLCQTNSFKEPFFTGANCDYYFFNQNQNLEIVNNSVMDFDNQNIITLQDAKNKAQDFLNFFIPPEYSPLFFRAFYYQGDYELFDSSPDQATSIQLEYNHFFQNIPILSQDDSNSSFAILINHHATFQKAEMPVRLIKVAPQTQFYSLISLNQALNNITLGQVYLLSAGNTVDSTNDTLDFNSITNLTLQEVIIEYRYNQANLLAIPYYHFLGSATDDNQNSFNLEILTPAIDLTLINN